MAFKGQEHFAFIKTSFNYDVDELCDRHLEEKASDEGDRK